jgi:aryl-alcohol dehydrogenase-like predicted oxidoreductase
VAQTFGLALIPWSPLGGGLLTDKYQRGQPIPADSRYANPNPIQKRRFVEASLYQDIVFDLKLS